MADHGGLWWRIMLKLKNELEIWLKRGVLTRKGGLAMDCLKHTKESERGLNWCEMNRRVLAPFMNPKSDKTPLLVTIW